MASKSKFISDFRSAVNALSDSHARLQALMTFMDSMGWQGGDAFSAELASADISPEEFSAALETAREILASSKNPATAASLAKLQP